MNKQPKEKVSDCCGYSYQLSVSTKHGRRIYCNKCGMKCETKQWDSSEGQTHYQNDGCGEKEHNDPAKMIEPPIKYLCDCCGFSKLICECSKKEPYKNIDIDTSGIGSTIQFAVSPVSSSVEGWEEIFDKCFGTGKIEYVITKDVKGFISRIIAKEREEAEAKTIEKCVEVAKDFRLGRPNLPYTHPEYERASEDNEINNETVKQIVAALQNLKP